MKDFESLNRQTLECVDKMIEKNNFGSSGFLYDFAFNCGNPLIFPEFFEGYNGDCANKEFLCCPYQANVLFGKREPLFLSGTDSCVKNRTCVKLFLENSPHLRLELLKRFKQKLENGYYVDCLKNDKPIEDSLLNDKEKEMVKEIMDKPCFKKGMSSSDINWYNNLLILKGSEDNPIPMNIFSFWYVYLKDHKFDIEKFKRTAKTDQAKYNYWTIWDKHFVIKDKDWYYEEINHCPQIMYEEIRPTDATIKTSLYWDGEVHKELFSFQMNYNIFTVPATEDLKKFYSKSELHPPRFLTKS